LRRGDGGLSHAFACRPDRGGSALVYGLRLALLSRRALADALGHIRKPTEATAS
jgi:hypothetical protein